MSIDARATDLDLEHTSPSVQPQSEHHARYARLCTLYRARTTIATFSAHVQSGILRYIIAHEQCIDLDWMGIGLDDNADER